VYDIEQNVGFLLSKAYQKGFSLFREQLLPYNITPPQFSILAFLWKEDGLSQTELCERSQVDRATMVGLVDRLEDEGLIKRNPQAGDRRAYRVCLTDKGRSLKEMLCTIASDVTKEFTTRLTAKEVDTLRGLLNKLRK
jgi:MarR family transcriptional regulator, lower aerobic nicotinate degradation pathway regulator